MPYHTVRLVKATPSSTPRSEAEVHIFAVCRRKEPIETSKVNELLSIHGHKAARCKQRMACLLLLRIEVPTVKTVPELQSRRSVRYPVAVPIIAPRRNGKNIRRFE